MATTMVETLYLFVQHDGQKTKTRSKKVKMEGKHKKESPFRYGKMLVGLNW